MAYSQYLADEISLYLKANSIPFSTKKMFMGICFFVDDKMLCGIHIDKDTQRDILLCRISESDYANKLNSPGCQQMIMGKKAMKNFVFVNESAFSQISDLYKWIDLCLKFNPDAKKSKK